MENTDLSNIQLLMLPDMIRFISEMKTKNRSAAN